MPKVHFLNVNDGDCSVIQHASGRVTVIDVSAAKQPSLKEAVAGYFARNAYESQGTIAKGVNGNFNRSEYPDNPIEYLKDLGITSVFRFISSHPDMDHLDGIKAFFKEFNPQNFWDTENTKELDDFDNSRYNWADWEFYKTLRDGNPQSNPKRLTLYSGAQASFYNEDGKGGYGDGLYILAPTPELVQAANDAGDWNDSSYVILFVTSQGKRILFAGDSHDETWEYILKTYKTIIADVDVLIAPHHGRDSGRDYAFLDTVNPKFTLFGNAPSEYLAYHEWNDRDLMFVTNNQAGTIILDIQSSINVFVAHKPFAEAFAAEQGYATYYSNDNKGYFLGQLR